MSKAQMVVKQNKIRLSCLLCKKHKYVKLSYDTKVALNEGTIAKNGRVMGECLIKTCVSIKVLRKVKGKGFRLVRECDSHLYNVIGVSAVSCKL